MPAFSCYRHKGPLPTAQRFQMMRDADDAISSAARERLSVGTMRD